MTAEVAISNIYGAAMAADSAVTLGQGKVYNSSDKLFALSKYHPVGIMIYHNIDIMGVGWETVIKNYRNELKDKSFDTLSAYAEDFIKFLSRFPYFSKKQMNEYLQKVCYSIFQNILDWFLIDLHKQYEGKGKITRRQIDEVFVQTLKVMNDKLNDAHVKPLEIDEDYIDAQGESINNALKDIFEKYPISKKLVQKITDLVKLNFRKRGLMDHYTGIVICGYGERELFPTTHSFKVGGKIGKGLVYSEEIITKINPDEITSHIGTYAQSEVVHTFFEGIDPVFSRGISNKMIYTLSSISEHLPDKYKAKIPKIIELFQEYMLDSIDLNYLNPVLEIVDTLQKDDITSMAEAMINLTALKRHVSTETETVGGPIDVAYISKGDGFIWIKKKTNYNPALNNDLFQSYFKGSQR